MKKLAALSLVMVMLLACATAVAEDVSVKTGLAWDDAYGLTVANVVEEDGQVVKVLVDVFRDSLSSKEKHNNYGMVSLSGIGKEWWEQALYFEEWVRTNGADAVELDDTNHATNADLISGATINLGNLTAAVKNAESDVAELNGYTVKTGVSISPAWGTTVANVILKDGEIVKVLIDVVHDDLSSKEKFDEYGMKSISSLGKDWWEQVIYFEDWVLANGVDAVELDDGGKATNVDLLSGATLNISDFTNATKDALSK